MLCSISCRKRSIASAAPPMIVHCPVRQTEEQATRKASATSKAAKKASSALEFVEIVATAAKRKSTSPHTKQPSRSTTSKNNVTKLLLEGVSTRGTSRLGGSTVCKSTISEQWIERSAEKLEEFRSRPLAEDGYVALMIDGVFLSKDQTAMVALGIREDGSKEMLDFKVGSSESTELAKALIGSLVKRGFKCVAKRLLVVLDYSNALENAVLAYYPTAIIQRCLVHKERNLQSDLSKRRHGELARLLKRLRRAEGKNAAKEAYDELYGFLEEHNAAALESLKEAGKTITALQDIGVPATLHRSLLSTNIIEDSILNIRCRMSKVNRWRAETKMADRYLAAGLL